jgi:hypothetical protein
MTGQFGILVYHALHGLPTNARCLAMKVPRP